MAKDFLSRMDADIRPPVENAASSAVSPFGRDGILRIALTAASVRVTIPEHWRGRDVDFTCDGGTGMYVLFGGPTVTLVTPATTVSTIAGGAGVEVATFVTGTGKKIEAGATKTYTVPNDAAITHFCWYGASAAGYIEAVNSTGNGVPPAP
ncbi:MAG: hypothetical protein WC211_00900 [Dehalococcoidia bacterium]